MVVEPPRGWQAVVAPGASTGRPHPATPSCRRRPSTVVGTSYGEYGASAPSAYGGTLISAVAASPQVNGRSSSQIGATTGPGYSCPSMTLTSVVTEPIAGTLRGGVARAFVVDRLMNAVSSVSDAR